MFALMGAMAAFAINDMMLKLTAQRYPLGEVITVRGTIATLLVGSLLIGFGQFTRCAPRPTSLCSAEPCSTAWRWSCSPPRSSTCRSRNSPRSISSRRCIITAAAVIFFAEEVGWRRWTAIAIGFLGTLLIIKPTPGAFNAWALLGVATAFAGVARDMITRKLDPRIPSI